MKEKERKKEGRKRKEGRKEGREWQQAIPSKDPVLS
jgi:hypothetical protein